MPAASAEVDGGTDDEYSGRGESGVSLPPALRATSLIRGRLDGVSKPHDVTHSPDALRIWCGRRQNVSLPVRVETAEAFKPRRPRGDIEGYIAGACEKRNF
jgi:hypothetical protein